MREALREAVTAVCRLVEAGAFGAAREVVDASPQRDATELAILRALATRRSERVEEAWLDALVGAWQHLGCPTGFVDGASEGASSAPEEPLPSGRAGLDLFGSPLLRLLFLGYEAGGADRLAREAMAAIPSAETVEQRLWLVALLSSQLMSPEVARVALKARASLRAELAQDRTRDFMLSAAACLDDGMSTEALSREQVEALRAAIDRHGDPLTLMALYGKLTVSRGARTSGEAESCLTDALAMMPDALMPLRMRFDATLSSSTGPERRRFLQVIRDVSEAYRNAPVGAVRLMALALGQLAAKGLRDDAAASAIEGELEWLRRAHRGSHRLPLDWPIEPLRREVVDEVARDECGLWKRTGFPPDRLG